MTLSRQAKFGLWALAAVIIAAASYFAGSALKPGEAPYYVFDTDAPAYGAPAAIAATSPGGFTGFGESDGSRSRVVISGRVTDLTETGLTLESSLGQRTTLTLGQSPRIYRLEPADAGLLRPGVSVAVRLNEAGDTVEGVLILSQP
jgi:hypothetical protein